MDPRPNADGSRWILTLIPMDPDPDPDGSQSPAPGGHTALPLARTQPCTALAFVPREAAREGDLGLKITRQLPAETPESGRDPPVESAARPDSAFSSAAAQSERGKWAGIRQSRSVYGPPWAGKTCCDETWQLSVLRGVTSKGLFKDNEWRLPFCSTEVILRRNVAFSGREYSQLEDFPQKPGQIMSSR